MDKIYEMFFRELLKHDDNISEYVDSLYAGKEYSDDDLNHIFGVLKREGLILCQYFDNRAWVQQITFTGKHYFDDITEENNKPRLIELIEQIEDVERAFHTVGGGRGMPQVEEIYDTQRFQEWIQELQYEIQKLSDEYQDDAYIKDTLTMVKRPLNGWRDRNDFLAIKSRLKVIEKNKDKYYSVKNGEDGNMNSQKKPLIFISHASKNKAEIGLLTDMLRAINLQPKQDIFCSSLPGYDIPVDTEDSIFDFLRNSFLNYDIHVFFIHSHEYYESPICLNEMGAAWALKSTQTSLLLPGFEFSDMKGVINGQKIAIKLDNDITEVKDKLNQVRKILVREFSLTPVPDTIWEQARDKFIREINRTE